MARGLKDNAVFMIGGVFPPDDIVKLKNLGFDGIFTPGAAVKEIVSFIHTLVYERYEDKLLKMGLSIRSSKAFQIEASM